jgi:dihydroflavonol-4-reductase
MHTHQPAHFWPGRRVALTGATGFVGHHLARSLAGLGARVTALVRATSRRQHLERAGVACVEADLEDAAALARGCRGHEFVFHAAAAVDFEADWDRFYRLNVEGTRNVIAAARAAGARRLIHTSSVVAIGASPVPRLLDESARWDLGRLRLPYVTTKRVAEEVALAASGPGLEVVVVNPGCVVGPEDHSGSEFGTLCRRFWRGRIPFHFGGGNNFVDVRDVAAGAVLAAARGRPGQRYILGGANRTYAAFFTDLARVARRPIVRLRLPSAVATAVGALNDRFRGRGRRSYLTLGQARLLSLFFFVDSRAAQRDLGYTPRPLLHSLKDAYHFWVGARSA